jgi:hypothetical protein
MEHKIPGFIYWAPRILGIIMVLFLAVFSLDVVGMAKNPGDLVVGMLMHNIPSFVLILLLVVSWKREIIGGIIFPLLGLAYSLSSLTAHWSVHLAISAPLILTGVLFLLCWNERRKLQVAL